jgi:hypothetical protein
VSPPPCFVHRPTSCMHGPPPFSCMARGVVIRVSAVLLSTLPPCTQLTTPVMLAVVRSGRPPHRGQLPVWVQLLHLCVRPGWRRSLQCSWVQRAADGTANCTPWPLFAPVCLSVCVSVCAMSWQAEVVCSASMKCRGHPPSSWQGAGCSQVSSPRLSVCLCVRPADWQRQDVHDAGIRL